MHKSALFLTVCLVGFSGTTPATGQDSSRTKRQAIGAAQAASPAPLSNRARRQLLQGQNKTDANANTTTIITSRTLGGAPMVMVRDLSSLLDKGDRFQEMRIVPVVARGKVQNLWDILYLKGIDAGWVQEDTFEYLKNRPGIASIKRRLAYITRVFPAEVHVVARKEIETLADLDGKTVSINAKGTGSSVVATILFERLGINAKTIHMDGGRAIARMKKGEIAAHFWVLGKPARPVRRIKAGDGLHLLPIPYTDEVKDVYYPSKFTNKDYPEIVAADGSVETISVGNVLAVYNWPETHDRYRKVSKFVNAFLSRLEELRNNPGFHPKWKQVNPYSKVRGWQRFKAAQDWINADLARRKRQQSKQTGSVDNNADFKKFLAEQNIAISDAADRNKLAQIVQEYLKWRDAQK